MTCRALRGLLDAQAGGFGGVAVSDGELLEFLPVQLDQLGVEVLRRVCALGGDRPVLAGDEGFDLFLALDDHAQRRALHAAGGQAALDLAPQHRRQVEADQVVQRAARLLGIDQVAIARGWLIASFDGARVISVNTTRCIGLSPDQPAFLQDLGDMPADRFTFAIRVGRQQDVVGALGGLGDGVDMFSFLSITS